MAESIRRQLTGYLADVETALERERAELERRRAHLEELDASLAVARGQQGEGATTRSSVYDDGSLEAARSRDASMYDMARVMDWLRRHSESGPGAEARAILSINPALPAPVAGKWAFVGYKGGSEPGVIHMTYLLQGKDGGWYVLSGGWNNPAAGVDEVRFASLMSRAAELAAGQ